MLLKISGAFLICLGTWLLGKNLSEGYRQKIRLIDQYTSFLKSFKSNVTFSGTNMYEFFGKYKNTDIMNFIDFLIEKKDNKQIPKFRGANKCEDECVKIISDALIIAQNSSDTDTISDFIDQAIAELTQYKKEFLEECYGKMKTAPEIGLIIGVFISVLVL